VIEHEDEFTSAILKSGPRSRRRRGIRFSSPLHSLHGAAWNVRKLGLGWWLYCLAINSWQRVLKAIRAARPREVLEFRRVLIRPSALSRTVIHVGSAEGIDGSSRRAPKRKRISLLKRGLKGSIFSVRARRAQETRTGPR
jgi:hypothetical protein